MTVAVESFQLIGFEKARVEHVTPAGVPWLIVEGTKPYLNMKVRLQPRIYIDQPDYWGIEVVGYLDGPGLPTLAPYVEGIALNNALGKKGIEVIGAGRTEMIDVDPLHEDHATAGPAAGLATYTAEQDGQRLTITAEGENPTAGYTNWIEQLPFLIFPPRYAFFSQPPQGPVPEVITPFRVSRTFVTAPNIKSVSIRDSAGLHAVAVTQMVAA